MKMKPVKAVITFLLIASIFLTPGCAGRDRAQQQTSAATPTPTPAPTATLPVTLAPTPTAQANYDPGIDPSLADVAGEGDESMPELWLPTPSPE